MTVDDSSIVNRKITIINSNERYLIVKEIEIKLYLYPANEIERLCCL